MREETLGQVETLRKEALILAKEEVLEERKSLEEEIQRKRKELQFRIPDFAPGRNAGAKIGTGRENGEPLAGARKSWKKKEVVESIKAREVEELSGLLIFPGKRRDRNCWSE